MPDTGHLSDWYLEQSPACHWIVNAAGAFERIYGDADAIFGVPAQQLVGCNPVSALGSEHGSIWQHRFARALAGELVLLRERREAYTWYVGVFPIRGSSGETLAGGLAAEVTPWSTAENDLRRTVLGALKAQEFERNTTARFLHDSVGQNLTAFGLQLDLIRMDLENQQPETCARVEEIQKVLEIMMGEVREYSYELNPATVERAGLRAALDRLVTRIRKRFPGVIRLNVDPNLKLDPRIATAMHHIVQEAVHNALQHANCSVIEIAVRSTRNGPALEVRDNGKGFDPGDILAGGRGLGLLTMEHYAAQAGLVLSFVSDLGKGTAVRVSAAGGA